MRVHLINPSEVSFGTAVITPRWLYVLAAATPRSFGDPVLVDETLAPLDEAQIQSGDIVGIGIHTAQCSARVRGGQDRARSAAHSSFSVAFTPPCIPNEAHELGGAHAVVKGDGDVIWSKVLADSAPDLTQRVYDGGRD